MRVDDTRFAWRRLDEAVVVLDLELADYFSLGGVAAELWDHLLDGADEPALIDHLVATYEIDRRTAEQDVAAFVAELRARSVVTTG